MQLAKIKIEFYLEKKKPSLVASFSRPNRDVMANWSPEDKERALSFIAHLSSTFDAYKKVILDACAQ